MSNRGDDSHVGRVEEQDSSGESIYSGGSDDVESGSGDDSIHTSDDDFIESGTSSDSEGEYQYNSDERSQSSGTEDEKEGTEGDEEDEDGLSSSELEALGTLKISSSPRIIPSLSRVKDCRLPLGRSSGEIGMLQ
jgi:hypothetical protein